MDNVTASTAVTMNVNPFSMGCNASTTAIEEQARENSVSVYPNPMNESAVINSEWKNCSIKIFDVTGNAVRNISDVNKFPFIIERGNLSSGVYMIELQSENKVERTKLVIE